jgi:hypothetical protein
MGMEIGFLRLYVCGFTVFHVPIIANFGKKNQRVALLRVSPYCFFDGKEQYFLHTFLSSPVGEKENDYETICCFGVRRFVVPAFLLCIDRIS